MINLTHDERPLTPNVMRIIHLACVAPPEIGGIGAVAFKEVASLRARGVDARLIAPAGKETIEKSFVERIEPVFRLGNASYLPLDDRLASADIVHLHYPFYGTMEPFLLGAIHQPIVVTFHMDARASGLKGFLFQLHRTFLQSFLLSRASKVLVSSFDYARHSSLAPWFKKHADRVTELPFGIDHDFFTPGPSVRNRFQLPESAPVILFVGGLDRAHAFKGVDVLLSAFALTDASTHLLLIGAGDLRPKFEERVRYSGMANRVHFLGKADQTVLRDAYRSADVCVLPSTNQAEAFGLVLLEAQSCGTPVIASDLPGVRTAVMHGETGLLVPPRDANALSLAFTQLFADPGRIRRMGERARERVVASFSWDKHVDQLLGVYESCCSHKFISA